MGPLLRLFARVLRDRLEIDQPTRPVPEALSSM